MPLEYPEAGEEHTSNATVKSKCRCFRSIVRGQGRERTVKVVGQTKMEGAVETKMEGAWDPEGYPRLQ